MSTRNEPLCSVILPAYNAETFIDEAITSILDQTYRNTELIITDDGSTDETAEKIKQFQHDKRVRFIKNDKNIGLIQTLNNSLSYANGEFIARMDADDISEHTRLETQIKYLQKHPEIDICGSNMRVFGNRNELIRGATTWQEARVNTFFSTPLFHPTVIFRKKIVNADFKYDKKFKTAEDYDLWERLIITKNIKALTVNAVLYNHRWHETNVSNTESAFQSKQADSIRLRQLKKLCPETKQHEAFILFMHLGKNHSYTENDLNNYSKLTSEIISANKNKGIYPHKIFKQKMNYRLFLHYKKAATHIGPKTIGLYLKHNRLQTIKISRLTKLLLHSLKIW